MGRKSMSIEGKERASAAVTGLGVVVYKNTSDLLPYVNNSRKHSPEQINQIAASIKEFGFLGVVLIDSSDTIIAGHCRVMAAQKLKIETVPCLVADHLTPNQIKAYVIADNRLALGSTWDDELLALELEFLKDEEFDLSLLGFDDGELETLLIEEVPEALCDEDDVPDVPAAPVVVLGDVWLLGDSRLMCGDSTLITDVERLMNGQLADMAHNDPPYGMKKEKYGVLNDNLNYDNLLRFNNEWITLQISFLKENASFYCWGIDEPLMDIYNEIIKPHIKKQQATFRNLITWDKGSGQGQNSEFYRMYPIADEKCLFVMMGVQGFNNNTDNYFEGWEPIRNYLLEQRTIAGWDIPTMKKIAGHSDLSRDHWTSKSQFNMPTKEVYLSFQNHCANHGLDAFKKEYDDLKKEYDDLKKEYDDLKKEHYSTRAYFNNTHDNQNNVWHFKRTSIDERKDTGGHATPKPIELCERAIKSSCPDGGLVLDLFGGSGSTLIACEKLSRKCYMMELDPKYVQVILERYKKFTGKDPIHENGKTYTEMLGKAGD